VVLRVRGLPGSSLECDDSPWPNPPRCLRTIANDAERLLVLVTLPWFRVGRMPRWLRLRVVEMLSAARRVELQKKVSALTSVVQSGDGDLAIMDGDGLPSGDPHETELDDAVALEFVTTARASAEAFPLADRAIHRRGVARALFMDLYWGGFLALAVTFGAWGVAIIVAVGCVTSPPTWPFWRKLLPFEPRLTRNAPRVG
jgi:hypothetical protein